MMGPLLPMRHLKVYSWPLASNGTSGVKPGVCLGMYEVPLAPIYNQWDI